MKIRPLFAALASLLLAATLATTLVTAIVGATPALQPVKADQSPGSRDVIVHLFQWPWDSIASECTNVLGPKGFGAIQVSPPQEHVVLDDHGYPWWQDYQPVSYQLESRRGDRAAFANMVSTCHNAGVKIYVDAIVNHMAGGASEGHGPGSGGSSYSHYDYPAVPYGYNDFHHCGRNGNDDIVNWSDRWEVQNCELVNLSDLATESGYVRGKLIGYLNDLISLGVDGFRIDAAKHVPVSDLEAIYAGLNGDPYIFHEVIEDSAFSPTEYAGIGDVTEFRYGDVVANAFRDANMSHLSNLAGQMALASGDAVQFIDNHDTQRNGRARLTYKDGQLHALAQAFSLAWPYGTPKLMSSFTFSDPEAGPPAYSDGTTQQVSCGSGWECEHRRTIVANLVGLHNEVSGTDVRHWVSPSSNRIAFARGDRGFTAFNRDGSSWSSTFTTSLPAGNYCDVASGDFADGNCTGNVLTVGASGQVTVAVPGNGMIALHTGARLDGTVSPSPSPTPSPTDTGCASVAVTFAADATTAWGENVYIAGSIPALGNWNTGNAIPMSSADYPIWKATVNLAPGTSFEYKYIKKNGSSVIWEDIGNRSHTVPSGVCAVTYSETWNVAGGGPGCTSIAVTFAADATTAWGEDVYIAGSIPALGNWNTGNAIPMSSADYPIWKATVDLAPDTYFEYKYIKKDGNGNITWENIANRSHTVPTDTCAVTYSEEWNLAD